ncbi:MAG: hypothetical protein ABI758_04405 [Candidatus Woesebacteria bacterium]
MVSKAKRMIFVSALAISIIGAGMYGTRSVFAQDSTVQSTIVQKIAQKFSLKTEEVQAVFDQERADREKEMEAKYEQRLTDAVSKGELTEEKKQLILTKHKELISNRTTNMEKFKAMTAQERKAAMQKAKTDLETWAKENGIDVKYLMGRMGNRGGFGKHFGGNK